MLQTRAPTRKSCGFVVTAGLLLSRPTMFQVIGGGGLVLSGGGTDTDAGAIRLMVRTGWAQAALVVSARKVAAAKTAIRHDVAILGRVGIRMTVRIRSR